MHGARPQPGPSPCPAWNFLKLAVSESNFFQIAAVGGVCVGIERERERGREGEREGERRLTNTALLVTQELGLDPQAQESGRMPGKFCH